MKIEARKVGQKKVDEVLYVTTPQRTVGVGAANI